MGRFAEVCRIRCMKINAGKIKVLGVRWRGDVGV